MRTRQSKSGPPFEQSLKDLSSRPSILVVDDEEHILKLYEKVLSEEGYQVKTATCGEEALRMAKERSPEVVILDIKLPDLNGLEILSGLRKLNRKTYIILNSAYSTYKSDFQSWLADAYLVKSPNLDELKQKVKELINIRKMNLIH